MLAAGAPPKPARAEGPLRVETDRVRALPTPAPRASAHRFALSGPIPAQPYRVVGAGLPTRPGISTELALARDGSVLVGTSAPHALWWVARDGSVRAQALLPSRPMSTPLEGADGRVYVVTDSPRRLTLVAPDGTARDGAELPRSAIGPTFLSPDGSPNVVVPSPSPTLLAFGPDLAPLGASPLPGAYLSDRVTDDGAGCAWLPFDTGLACLGAGGPQRTVPHTGGAQGIWLIDTRAVAVQQGRELRFRDPRDGSPLGRADLGASVSWAGPVGRLGLGVVRNATPPDLTIYAPDGRQLGRVPLQGGAVNSVLADATGALLVVFTSGELVALEPDGAPRWSARVGGAIDKLPLVLPDGALALATQPAAVGTPSALQFLEP